MNIELTPAEAPEVECFDYALAGDPERGLAYALFWPTFGLSVTLTGPELQELIARSMIAQAAGPS